MGMLKSMRDLKKQTAEMQASLPPVGQRMAQAQARMAGVLFADRLSKMTNSRYPSGRAARIGLSAARVCRAPLCSRRTPHSWSSPRA